MSTLDKEILEHKLKEKYGDIFEEGLLKEIAQIGVFQKLKKGRLFVDIGDELTHIPLILDGVLKVSRIDDEENEILLYYLDGGHTCAISFANCINRTQSIFRAVAEKESECILIPVNLIEYWLIKYHSWREFIIDSYHERLLEMVHSIESLAFLKLDDRLKQYLEEKSKIMHSDTLELTHQKIATDLHTSRVVISRMLKQMEKEHIIDQKRNSITLLSE